MVVALADMAGLQKVASFTLNNLYKPGDTIHTTYVEDTANSGEIPFWFASSVLRILILQARLSFLLQSTP